MEDQEAWNRKLHNIEDIPIENTESALQDTSADLEFCEPNLEEETMVFDVNGIFVVPTDANLEVLEITPELSPLVCSIYNFRAKATAKLN